MNYWLIFGAVMLVWCIVAVGFSVRTKHKTWREFATLNGFLALHWVFFILSGLGWL